MDGNYNNANLQGVTASGLLSVYERTHSVNYLNAAKNAGNSLVARYDGQPNNYDNRPFTQDIEFLVHLSLDTGDPTYQTKAIAYFNRIAANKTAADLVNGIISARGSMGGWDVASRIRAAWDTGYTAYANGLTTALIAQSASWVSENATYGWDYTPLAYGSLLWAYHDIGYSGPEIGSYRVYLLSHQGIDGSWDGADFQTTAYAILGLSKVGGTGVAAALSNAATFLVNSQVASGGWVYPAQVNPPAPASEYGEVDSEVLMGLGSLIPQITSSLSECWGGKSYSQALSVSGGTGPYTWSVVSGNLPDGFTINANTGVISGKTVHAYLASSPASHTYNFTVQVTDSTGNTGTQSLSITVDCPRADVNGDGKINILDVSAIGDPSVWLHNVPPGTSADVNGDGKVNILDVGAVGDPSCWLTTW